MNLASRYRGCLLGLACGDAVGSAVEFRDRGSFPPLTDMIGGGLFNLPVGAWTDDTSMALCLAASLVELGMFDPTDQMTRYCRWYKDGYLSSTGKCFDVGVSTSRSLHTFLETGNPYCGRSSPASSGNGCIMRLAPVPMFFYPNIEQAIDWSRDSARTTHGSLECLESTALLGAMICKALSGASKEDILLKHGMDKLESTKVREIAAGTYRDKPMDQIHSSGYVIHCLEAAAWCFWKTDNYRDAILMASNLGDDSDTTAAVCGQLAGAFFGEEGIPKEWLEKLMMVNDIRTYADRLHAKM